jgi:hypothetical protein
MLLSLVIWTGLFYAYDYFKGNVRESLPPYDKALDLIKKRENSRTLVDTGNGAKYLNGTALDLSNLLETNQPLNVTFYINNHNTEEFFKGASFVPAKIRNADPFMRFDSIPYSASTFDQIFTGNFEIPQFMIDEVT